MPSPRRLVVSSAAMAATTAPAFAGLDPTDADIKFGTTGSIFGPWNGPPGPMELAPNMKMATNMKRRREDVKIYGLQGFELYAAQVVQYLGKPEELKKLSEEVGIQI